MTLTISVVAVIIGGVVGTIIYLSGKGVPRSLSQLKMPIQNLLDQNGSDGTLIFNHKLSNKFLQFSKYACNTSNYGVELSFPKASWSTGYFEELKEYCVSKGVSYRIQEGSDGMIFLDIDFKKNVDEAYETVRHIVLNIFELPEDSIFEVLLNRAR